jgi:hypothetical protein
MMRGDMRTGGTPTAVSSGGSVLRSHPLKVQCVVVHVFILTTEVIERHRCEVHPGLGEGIMVNGALMNH